MKVLLVRFILTKIGLNNLFKWRILIVFFWKKKTRKNNVPSSNRPVTPLFQGGDEGSSPSGMTTAKMGLVNTFAFGTMNELGQVEWCGKSTT